MNSYHYTQLILAPFFRELSEEEKMQLLHAKYCSGSHSKLLMAALRRGIWQIVDKFLVNAGFICDKFLEYLL
jgi:cell division inhibitor SulA